jgi:hypothetical protein
VVRQNRLRSRERVIVLEIEKGLQHNIWRRRITSTQLNSQLTHSAAYSSRAAAHGSSSSFSLLLVTLLSHTLTFCSQI